MQTGFTVCHDELRCAVAVLNPSIAGVTSKPLRLVVAQLFASPLPPVIAAHVSQRIYSEDQAWNDGCTFCSRARTGSLYTGTTRDMHARALAIHGYFDWRLVATAAYLCRAGETIVEVGANVGTETIAFADIVGADGHVYAFEPMPSNVEQLTRAIHGATLAQVEIIESAVSDTSHPVTFSPPPNERESGSGYICENGRTAAADQLTVNCVTLDSHLAGKNRVHLLVIDAEGGELNILRGCPEVLQRDRPPLILEAQELTLRRYGFGLSDLLAELHSHAYDVYELARFGLRRPRVEDTGRICNWLALPPSRANEAPKIHRHLLKCGLFPCVRCINPLTKRYR